jgi:hypothetical protein
MEEGSFEARIALHGLAAGLIALGQHEDGKAFLRLMHATSDWACDHCEDYVGSEEKAGMCEYCLGFFCGLCFEKLKEPRGTRFCVLGHSLVEVAANVKKIPEGMIRFRGACVKMGECLDVLRSELQT